MKNLSSFIQSCLLFLGLALCGFVGAEDTSTISPGSSIERDQEEVELEYTTAIDPCS